MDADKILLDVLKALYPQTGVDIWALSWFVLFLLVGVMGVVLTIFFIKEDSMDDPFAMIIEMIGLIAILLCVFFYWVLKEDRGDRLVKELVNDPASLEVVQRIRRDLEWVGDPKKQRNKEEK